MVTWRTKISDATATTSALYGGQTVDSILDYFSNVDLSNAGADANGLATISTYTRFATNAFQFIDPTADHTVKFTVPEYTENHTIALPTEAALGSTDELLLKDAVQAISGKTIDFGLNSLINAPDTSGIAAAGTFSANGNTTTFNIPHTLTPQPDYVSVEAASTDARASLFSISITSTNIVVTYTSAPQAGTNNVSFIWFAGYIGAAGSTFTPSTTNTMLNKTIGDSLTFDKVALPTDPTPEQGRMYVKELDANNNGLFILIQKNGAITEVQIA